MRRKRRSRKNAWPKHPRLHAKAARKGHRRSRLSRRRTRRNAGAMSIVKNTTRSLRAGFNPSVIKRAGAILLGNISTTWYVDQIGSRIHMIRTNPVLEVGSLLLLAGAQGVFVDKVLKQRKYASDILIGGILAGVTRAVKTVLPNQFATCGLSDDLDGLGSYYASPMDMVIGTQMGHPHGTLNQPGRFGPHMTMRGIGYGGPDAVQSMDGLGWAPGPDTREFQMHGMEDYAPPTMPFNPAHARQPIHIDMPHPHTMVHPSHPAFHPAHGHMHGLAMELADQM